MKDKYARQCWRDSAMTQETVYDPQTTKELQAGAAWEEETGLGNILMITGIYCI